MKGSWVRVLGILMMGGLVAAGCGDDVKPDDGLLPRPPAGEGEQFTMTTRIEAGQEVEHCQFVTAPDHDMWIYRDEVRFTAGSHHFLLYETPYTSIPTQKEDGTVVDTSGVFDCSDGATNGWRVSKLVGGSQNGDGDSALMFPEGVGMQVHANAVLLMNAHYVNATDEAVEPEVAINLYTRKAESIRQRGDILFLYNPLIKAAANADSRARWRCPVNSDITIVNMQSHMHRRGIGYAAMVTGQAPFYENGEWENVPVKQFPDGLEVKAGSTLDYYCDYRNQEARDVYQGPRTTDEMCMLIASFYPADPQTANCLDTDDRIAGEWVGNGTATCAETLTCIQAASQSGAKGLEPFTDCMVKAAPAVSAESSAVFRCLLTADGDPAVACKATMDACQAK